MDQLREWFPSYDADVARWTLPGSRRERAGSSFVFGISPDLDPSLLGPRLWGLLRAPFSPCMVC